MKTISNEELYAIIDKFIAKNSDKKKVLLIPPDHTRYHSKAGIITAHLYKSFCNNNSVVKVLPALGTHKEMSCQQYEFMFGDTICKEDFLVHDWKNDVIHLGTIDNDFIRQISDNIVDFKVDIAVSKYLFDDYDLIVSIGQVVPHEVIGMANYTKNILVGVGGKDCIDKSHFLGASYNMEKIMGEANNPVRSLLNHAYDKFIRPKLDIEFILTVLDNTFNNNELKGVFIGKNDQTYLDACSLSQQYNIIKLEEELETCIVYLDENEFHSTWLGNKAIYRTRKAMKDNGNLIILAPKVSTFGEDEVIDSLIRKYGYNSSDIILQNVKENADLQNNLSAAAHLIHGTCNNRFNITYCTSLISKEDINKVYYNHLSYEEAQELYDVSSLKDGYNIINGKKVFFIKNPALSLWQKD